MDINIERKEKKLKNCPEWFGYVSLVILYNAHGQILLGKRKPGKAEGSKWAILGGSGAFPESVSPEQFAWLELDYDISLPISFDLFRLWKRITAGGILRCLVTDLFSYKAGEEDIIDVNTSNTEAPEIIAWFTLREIKAMGGRKEIAFDNAAILLEFGREVMNIVV